MSAEADAGAEAIGDGDERYGDRHEPTNFLVVPRSALLPACGRHSAVRSMSCASSTSLAVTPPALCVHSFTCTLPQLTARSGWLSAASPTIPMVFTNIKYIVQ